MIITIKYDSITKDNYVVESDNIIYAYVENELVLDETSGAVSQSKDGRLVLKFETPDSLIVPVETRSALYNIYAELIKNLDDDINIAITNMVQEIEVIEDSEGITQEITIDKEATLFDTEIMGLRIESVSLIDRALTDMTQDINTDKGISVQVFLNWKAVE